MLDRSPALSTLISIFPGLVLAHVLEESGTLLPWRDRHWSLIRRLPSPFREAAPKIRPPHLATFYGGMSTFIAGSALLARRAPRGSGRMVLLGVAAWTTLLGVSGHLVLSAGARRYTPGGMTALALLPYAGYLVSRLARDRALSRWQMGLTLLLALPLDPPVHLSAALLGRVLRGRPGQDASRRRDERRTRGTGVASACASWPASRGEAPRPPRRTGETGATAHDRRW